MTDALPSLSQMLLFWLPTFLFGVLVGTYQERHKESVMDLANSFRVWYDRWAPMVVSAVALVALIGIVVSTVATVTNGAQDRRADRDAAIRDEGFKAVQGCFDRYAIAQSASSQAVREASVVKDEATKVFNQALNDEGRAFKRLVAKLQTRTVTPEDVAALYETLEARDRAGRAVERAQVQLDRARAENPVPPAPSEFCSVKP